MERRSTRRLRLRPDLGRRGKHARESSATGMPTTDCPEGSRYFAQCTRRSGTSTCITRCARGKAATRGPTTATSGAKPCRASRINYPVSGGEPRGRACVWTYRAKRSFKQAICVRARCVSRVYHIKLFSSPFFLSPSLSLSLSLSFSLSLAGHAWHPRERTHPLPRTHPHAPFSRDTASRAWFAGSHLTRRLHRMANKPKICKTDNRPTTSLLCLNISSICSCSEPCSPQTRCFLEGDDEDPTRFFSLTIATWVFVDKKTPAPKDGVWHIDRSMRLFRADFWFVPKITLRRMFRFSVPSALLVPVCVAMVNIHGRRCQHPGCDKQPTFGRKGHKVSHGESPRVRVF